MKHLILSHYDLDGIGCVINIYNSIKNKERDFQYLLGGYTSLSKKIKKLEKETADVLWITDLNLKEEHIKSLHDVYIKLNLKKIIMIDHHVYEYNLTALIESYGFDGNFISIIDKTKCASLLTLEVLHQINPNHNYSDLYDLNGMINIYDTWMKTDKDWNNAYGLNDLFWEYNFEKFFSKFKYGYKLDDEDKKIINDLKKDRELYVKDTIDNYFAGSDETSTVFILNPACKYTNHFTLVFKDVKNYVILKQCQEDQFSYSIRLYNEDLNLTIQELFAIIKQMGINVITSGGHDKVGAITISYDDNEKFLEAISNLI
jgi:oligoribonuclease NrnB/cAMP/cGMP phosphodiesterase (DHH superfamily)